MLFENIKMMGKDNWFWKCCTWQGREQQGQNWNLSLGIKFRVCDQRPAHTNHTVQASGQLMRLCYYFQSCRESIRQSWQNQFRAKCGQILEGDTRIPEAKLGPHGLQRGWLQSFNKCCYILVCETVFLGRYVAPFRLLVPLAVDALHKHVGQLVHETSQYLTVPKVVEKVILETKKWEKSYFNKLDIS